MVDQRNDTNNTGANTSSNPISLNGKNWVIYPNTGQLVYGLISNTNYVAPGAVFGSNGEQWQYSFDTELPSIFRPPSDGNYAASCC